MGLTAKEPKGGEDFELVGEGIHVGPCIGIFDLGTQYSEHYDKSAHKVIVMWEIPDERIQIEKDGETQDLPRAISRTFTLSLHKKAALRQILEAWRGRSFTDKELEGFDIFKVLGHGCQIQVIHDVKDEKTYANVSTVMALPKGLTANDPENVLRKYSIEDDGLNIPENTPDWIKDKIKNSEEYKSLTFDNAVAGVNDEPPLQDEQDIPF